MNTEQNIAAAAPAVAAPPAGPVEVKIKAAIAGPNFSYRPGEVVTLSGAEAGRLVKGGLAEPASEADKAAAAVQSRAKATSDDNAARARQAEDKAKVESARAEKAALEAKGLRLERDRLNVNVEELEKDNKTLIERTTQQEAEIAKLNAAAEGLRNAAADAAEDARKAGEGLAAVQANLDQAREALAKAEEANAAHEATIAKLTAEVASRDKQLEAAQKRTAAKK